MNKLTFKVKDKSEISLLDLIKTINQLTCRIKLDFENNFVIAENLSNSEIDTIIDLINSHYTILSIDIDNSDTVSTILQPESKISSPEANSNETDSEIIASDEKTNTSNKLENALLENLGDAFDKLDPSGDIEDQINSFIKEIGFPEDDPLIKHSFVIACNLVKITYENVIYKLHEVFTELQETTIKYRLKEFFKEWMSKHPELEDYPRMSFMIVLKVFVKRINNK